MGGIQDCRDTVMVITTANLMMMETIFFQHITTKHDNEEGDYCHNCNIVLVGKILLLHFEEI